MNRNVGTALRRPASLDLDKDQRLPVRRDQIDLAEGTKEISRKDVQTATAQVTRRDSFAFGTQPLTPPRQGCPQPQLQE